MDHDILLCCDLDRTVLPNGHQPESPEARPRLRLIARRPEITLVYVSGRDRALLEAAIREYDIPVPAYAIGDVGTTIYAIQGDRWRAWNAWREEIAPDWAGLGRAEMHRLLAGVPGLTLQEPEKQNAFKLSYYAPRDTESASLRADLSKRLRPHGVRASIIWSVDEAANVGLLDVLPAGATKLHAIRFLMQAQGFAAGRMVFAGDSGNDLPVLTSGLQSVLVRNAATEVRALALREMQRSGRADKLYLAQGGFLGMNGNYAAGVLEGLAHYLPETKRWMVVNG
jgi:HAD superfamily hydrolase (TIGR01484 family)